MIVAWGSTDSLNPGLEQAGRYSARAVIAADPHSMLMNR